MNQTYIVGAYWGSRSDGLEVCASSLVEYLEKISVAHPSLGSWYPKGSIDRISDDEVFSIRRDDIEIALNEGRSRRDTDKTEFDDLGYTINLWNGPEYSMTLSIRCGSSSDFAVNHVVLTIPADSANKSGLLDSSIARRIIESTVSAWTPEWATWTTRDWRTAQRATTNTPILGWLNYLGPKWISPLSPLPPQISEYPFHEGRIIQILENAEELNADEIIEVRQQLNLFSVA